MALLGNYSVILKNPATFIGGTQVSNCRNAFNAPGQLRARYYGEMAIPSAMDRASLPNGYRPPYTWSLAPKTGGLSTTVSGSGSLSALGQNGLAATADLVGSGTISNAAGSLIVEMIAALAGSGTLTASIIGNLEAIAALAGSGSLTAAQSALAGMVADLIGSGIISSSLATALGEMVANIYVNESQATVVQIVDGVWEALTADHVTPGTMGEAMGAAGTAGNPWTDTSTYGAGTKGKLLQDAADSAELASIS